MKQLDSAAMPNWWICVLNWNGRDDTLRCLRSLERSGADGIVVADNGSVDGSVEAIRIAFPDVELVENGANLGFSGGNNAAIRRALELGADWVVLLNNDAELEPGALEAFAAAPEAGVLAGKLLYPDGRVQWAGQRVGLKSGYSGRPRGDGQPDGPEFEVPGPVARAVGALMAVSRPAIDAAGLLDEDLFAYVEDVDWSLRVREAGFACRFVPQARAHHALSASTGGGCVDHAAVLRNAQHGRRLRASPSARAPRHGAATRVDRRELPGAGTARAPQPGGGACRRLGLRGRARRPARAASHFVGRERRAAAVAAHV